MTRERLLTTLFGFLAAGLVTVSVAAVDAAIGVDSPGRPELALAVLNWEQANSNGFGDAQTLEVTALEVFNGFLYAGTFNPINPEPLYDGAQILRSADGVTWTPVTQPGFGNTHDIAPPAILDFVVFNNRLYASTGRGNASQIWRSLNGLTWAPMNVTGFGNPENVNVTALAVYNAMIYAGVTNQVTGAQVWRSFTGDNNTWEQVAPVVPGTGSSSITGFAEFDGGLYAAVDFEDDVPAQIWRSYGGAWEVVVDDGFGNNTTFSTGGLVVFSAALYVGAGNADIGAQIWRSADGSVWTQIIAPGFGDSNNQEVEMVSVSQNRLYASVKNAVTGIEIWRTADGTNWEQVNPDGFGDINNTGTNRSNARAEFLNQLYVGTSNIVDGGELWRATTVTAAEDTRVKPSVLALRHVGLNPSSVGSRIAFDLPQDAQVSLELYDVRGRLVLTLAQQGMPAGTHQISWDGTDNIGHKLAAGTYLYRLRAGALHSTIRFTVVR